MALSAANFILKYTNPPPSFLSSKLFSFHSKPTFSFPLTTFPLYLKSITKLPLTTFCSSTTPTPTPTATTTATDAVKDDAVKNAAGLLDLRVGRILKAWKHPEAENLYVEEVDVGEEEPRTICSGLVKFVPLEYLDGLHVIVVANLKPRKMVGVVSNGMLMAASDEKHENVELLLPAEGSVVGERVWFGGEDGKEGLGGVATPNQVQKKKYWELVQPELKTDEECVAKFREEVMRTSAGLVTCKSLRLANIG